MSRPLDVPTFPLNGTRLIEASAGTGKTYTIAALYLRLVLGHGGANGFSRPLSPPEILVLTFTNAATEELRDRIRRRLAAAAGYFRGQDPDDDVLTCLGYQIEKSRWPAQARLLDQAAQWMDEAAIHTIHGWCQRMLHQHAFDSGALFDLTLEPDDRGLLDEAARDYWRCHLVSRPAKILDELMGLSSGTTPETLLERVRPWLAPPPEVLNPAQDPFDLLDRRREAIETARRLWQTDFESAVEGISRARSDGVLNGNRYRFASLKKWLVQLDDWVHHSAPLPDPQVLQKFSQTGLNAGVNRNREAPRHPAYEAFDRLGDILEQLDIDTALVRHAARYIHQRFQREKQRHARMGYDDLITRLNEALEQPGRQRLAAVIRRQFPVALVDEFQDTDPAQYAIFRRIYFRQPDTALVMIGDPKQAIYGFRGADIHTYLNARADTEGRRYTLGRNYRSTQAVVQAVNRIFGSAADRPRGAFLFGRRIPFEPVAAQGRKSQLVVDDRPVRGVQFRYLEQSVPVNKHGPEGYLQQMAAAAAAEIVRLLNLAAARPSRAGFRSPGADFAPLCPAHIAVLVRDGTEAGTIRQALALRGVRSVYLSNQDSVFDGDEAVWLLYLLRACAQPEQERHLKAALAADLLDLPFSHLDRLNRDELAWETEVERFRHYRRIWQRQGVLPMLRTLLDQFGVPARLLSVPGGERVLTNCLHLAELLQAAAARVDGERALIRWLSEQTRQPGGGGDEQILRLESDEALVRVVTVHKAKGLEYPLVFVPFVCSFREVTPKNTSVAKYHDNRGRWKWVPRPGKIDLAAADRERLAEDLRLLYVALTRPQYTCWLGIGVMGRVTREGETSLLHQSALGDLLGDGQPIPTTEVLQRLTDIKADCEHIAIAPLPPDDNTPYRVPKAATQLLPARMLRTAVPCNWRMTSYSGILAGMPVTEHQRPALQAAAGFAGAADSAVEDQLQEAGVEPVVSGEMATGGPSIHTFPRGPEAGTFLHGLLEWAAEEGFAELILNPQRVYDHVQTLCRPRSWEAWTGVLGKWLLRLLQTPLALPAGQGRMTLAHLESRDIRCELEFLFAAHGVDLGKLDQAVTRAVMPTVVRPRLGDNRVNGMLKGFIDVVFCHRGRYYVLDYKSNHLGADERAYDHRAMTAAMAEHRYDLQSVLYTLALHRLLKARLAGYDYQRDVGGALYLFLRGVNTAGQGVWSHKPPPALIERLDRTFAGRETNHDN